MFTNRLGELSRWFDLSGLQSECMKWELVGRWIGTSPSEVNWKYLSEITHVYTFRSIPFPQFNPSDCEWEIYQRHPLLHCLYYCKFGSNPVGDWSYKCRYLCMLHSCTPLLIWKVVQYILNQKSKIQKNVSNVQFCLKEEMKKNAY